VPVTRHRPFVFPALSFFYLAPTSDALK
jgi:hypothetical protein